MKYIQVGEVVTTFGIKGELKVKSSTDFNEERFKPKNHIYLMEKQMHEEVIETYRVHKGMVMISFEGKRDINMIEHYVGCTVHVKEDDIQPLGHDEYFYRDLKNLHVLVKGVCIGEIVEVEEYPASAIVRIKHDKGEMLVPFVKAFFGQVDLQNKTIEWFPIEGML